MSDSQSSTPAPALFSWPDVDEALRRMAELDIILEEIDGAMTTEINQIKEIAVEEAVPHQLARARLELQVVKFCETHKADFTGDRHVKLNFGKVAYRFTKGIVIPAVETCIAALKKLGLDEYLRIKEEPDKKKMLELDSAMLAKIGAHLETRDALSIKPNIERVKEMIKANLIEK